MAVDRWIAHPEQVEIGAIQNENRRQPQPPWLSRDYMRNLSERPRGSHSTSFQERTGGGGNGDHLVRSRRCGGGSPVQPVLLACPHGACSQGARCRDGALAVHREG